MGGTTTTGLPYPEGSDMVRDADNVIKALAQRLDTMFGDTGWISLPTLQNGWTQYGGWEAHGYRKKNGLVFLRGLLAPGTVASGTLIVTLPEGFRNGSNPGAHIPVAAGTGAPNQGGAVIQIWNDGRVLTNKYVSGYLSLNNICYPAEN